MAEKKPTTKKSTGKRKQAKKTVKKKTLSQSVAVPAPPPIAFPPEPEEGTPLALLRAEQEAGFIKNHEEVMKAYRNLFKGTDAKVVLDHMMSNAGITRFKNSQNDVDRIGNEAVRRFVFNILGYIGLTDQEIKERIMQRLNKR